MEYLEHQITGTQNAFPSLEKVEVSGNFSCMPNGYYSNCLKFEIAVFVFEKILIKKPHRLLITHFSSLKMCDPYYEDSWRTSKIFQGRLESRRSHGFAENLLGEILTVTGANEFSISFSGLIFHLKKQFDLVYLLRTFQQSHFSPMILTGQNPAITAFCYCSDKICQLLWTSNDSGLDW